MLRNQCSKLNFVNLLINTSISFFFQSKYKNKFSDTTSFVQSYFLDKLQLIHLIIHELNVIGGIL